MLVITRTYLQIRTEGRHRVRRRNPQSSGIALIGCSPRWRVVGAFGLKGIAHGCPAAARIRALAKTVPCRQAVASQLRRDTRG